QEIAGWIQPIAREHRRNAGEAGGELRNRAGVEPGTTRRVRSGDRSGHDIARRELGARICVEGETATAGIQEHSAGATHGLGDERSRVDAGKLECGWMELQKLQISQLRPYPMRQRPSVR